MYMLSRALACQQPLILFPTFPKLRTDAKQDLRPSLHLAVFDRGEIVRLIPISVKLSPAGNSHGAQNPTLVLSTSLLQAKSNPRSDANRALLSSGVRSQPPNSKNFLALFRKLV
jgi:hypothetical protein